MFPCRPQGFGRREAALKQPSRVFREFGRSKRSDHFWRYSSA